MTTINRTILTLVMALLLVIALTAGADTSHGDPFQQPEHAIPGF